VLLAIKQMLEEQAATVEKGDASSAACLSARTPSCGQWGLIEPLLPEPGTGAARRRTPSARSSTRSSITCAPWRMLAKDFPPWETVYGYFRDWRKDGHA